MKAMCIVPTSAYACVNCVLENGQVFSILLFLVASDRFYLLPFSATDGSRNGS